jgi:hypothetical protein
MERNHTECGTNDESDSPLRIDSNRPGPGVIFSNILLIKETQLRGNHGSDTLGHESYTGW